MRSEKEGETAALFNQLAEAIAILAFAPGGIPSLSGQRFDAEEILAGFIGIEQARAYCQRVRTHA
ncbi:hypothetical protein KSX_80730 [Ktedonospora formicarum]|uniref:Uncharacterized protein n=1 Tax=Ktedonospora formicarum TaxID=2778364 RepID=A0A8J3MYP9_9CHLR|nr:hypothetical protein KSX_80730 [Ktedonospora formicarum]